MIKILKAQYSDIESISTNNARKLAATLDNATDETLKDIVSERVKFCWRLALNRLIRRGYKAELILRQDIDLSKSKNCLFLKNKQKEKK